MRSADSPTGQALGVRILQAVLMNMSDVEMKTSGSLKPGKEGDRFVKMQPAKNSHYIGIASKDKEINPVTIGGTWYPKRPLPGTATDVILHFHGGKFLYAGELDCYMPDESSSNWLTAFPRSLCDWRWTSRRLWFRGKDSSAAHLSHVCFLPTVPPCFKPRRPISSPAAGCCHFASTLDR
jgi:hypothetical protein